MNYYKKLLPIALASIGIVSNASVAKAVNFNFTYEPGMTLEQIAAMETAGMIWSNYLADDMTVNIHVESTNELDNNIVGGALPGMVSKYDYCEFRSLLNSDRKSWFDDQAYNNLSVKHEHGHEKFTAWFDTGVTGFTEDSGQLSLTRANAKAIGAIHAHARELDGYILMNDLSNSSASWNYDLFGNDSNSLDYLSVATHEIGHILGFVSGVDRLDIDKHNSLNSLNNAYANKSHGVKDHMDKLLDHATPLDMFRYSSKSKEAENNNEYYNIIDFTTSQQAYFSVDGGNSFWHEFAQGQDDDDGWGDGYQASHWKQKDRNQIGIMDPLINVGQRRQASNRDLQAFDVIGYDISHNGYKLIDAGSDLNGWLVTGVGADLSALEYQAKENFVKKYYSYGDASWIDWAIAFGYNTETTGYTQSLVDEVQTMIADSKTYEGRRSKGSWQTAAFWQEAYLQEFKWQTIDSSADSKSVPEPGSIAGFITLGLMSLTTLIKRKNR